MASTLNAEYDHLFKVLCVGDSAVGKSSLVNRCEPIKPYIFLFDRHPNPTSKQTKHTLRRKLLTLAAQIMRAPDVDREFDSRFVSTIGVDFKIKTLDWHHKTVKLQIWDTAGQERFRAITTSYYRGADGIIMVYDVTNPKSLEALMATWAKEIKSYAGKNPRILLVGNKSDLRTSVDDETLESVEGAKERLRELLAYDGAIEVVETSAKGDSNVDAAFESLVDEMVDRAMAQRVREATRKERGTRSSNGSGFNLLSPATNHRSSAFCCNLL